MFSSSFSFSLAPSEMAALHLRCYDSTPRRGAPRVRHLRTDRDSLFGLLIALRPVAWPNPLTPARG
jgi:hypothetical protein